METTFGSRIRSLLLRGPGYVIGFVLLLVTTFILLGIPPLKGLSGIWTGAAGNSVDGHWYALSETLVKSSPLLLTGLGVSIAWRAGMFSIGGEGQLLMGALAATALWKAFPGVSAPLMTIGMLLAGTVSGAIWGGLAGWLRVKRNVQEVISTIMLNYIAIYLVGSLVNGPLQEHAHISPQSDPIPDAILFARLVPASVTGGIQSRVHSGVLLAFLVVPIITLFLFRSASGFGLRLVGQNSEAARVARFPVDSYRVRAMLLSGALCGLAGVIELLGISTRLDVNFSPGWGYTAIPVALVGGLQPFGILLASLFFGGLTAGCGYLSRFYGVSSDLINVIQGTAVIILVGVRAWKARRSGSDTD